MRLIFTISLGTISIVPEYVTYALYCFQHDTKVTYSDGREISIRQFIVLP